MKLLKKIKIRWQIFCLKQRRTEVSRYREVCADICEVGYIEYEVAKLNGLIEELQFEMKQL